MVEQHLLSMVARLDGVEHRGRGLAQGLVCDDHTLVDQIVTESFERGLIIETSGPEGEVAKLMPPIVIAEAELALGLELFTEAVDTVMGSRP